VKPQVRKFNGYWHVITKSPEYTRPKLWVICSTEDWNYAMRVALLEVELRER